MYKNNWISWSYDGIELGKKTHPSADFSLTFNPIIQSPVKSLREELLNNAKLIRDTYTGNFDLLLSGGADSEVVLRVYHELKIPVNVFVFRYEKEYNYRDVAYAQQICQELDVKYTLIDFNLQKFIENDAYNLWLECYPSNVARLPHLKMLDYLDNIPIIGSGEPEWFKINGKWLFELSEGSFIQQIHQYHKGRVVLADWFNYSPEVTASYMQNPLVWNLINDKFSPYKKSAEIKWQVYNYCWPALKMRTKLIGFEGKGDSGTIEPEFMREFNQTYIGNQTSNTRLFYTNNELINLLYVKS